MLERSYYNEGGFLIIYKGINIDYYEDIVVYKGKEKVLCHVKNWRNYEKIEVNFFLKMLIDTFPGEDKAIVDKEWDMDEWVDRVRDLMN